MSVKFIATSCLGGPRPPRRRVGLATLMLALTIVAVALVAALCASSASSEIDRALRLSWWFS